MMDILPEPVSKWQNLNGTDMLGLVYRYPERWATAQVYLKVFESKSQNQINHFIGILCSINHVGRTCTNGFHFQSHGKIHS